MRQVATGGKSGLADVRTAPTVSVVVLNWNGERYLDPFFESLAQQTYPAELIDVVFVDNASSDASVARFEALQIPRSQVVQTGANLGYSGGNNAGIRLATGDFVAVCNNDLILAETWLENLVGAATETSADVVVPKLIYQDSGLINNAGSVLVAGSTWPNFERGMGSDQNDPEFAVRCEVTSFCGASPLFRQDFLQRVGLFDPTFFLYWEDSDLAWRGQRAGSTYIYEPSAIALHAGSGSVVAGSRTFNHYVSRNRILVLLKNGALPLAAACFAEVFLHHVVWKLRDVGSAVRRRSGRRESFVALWRGCLIIAATLRWAPVALLKRFRIISEESL